MTARHEPPGPELAADPTFHEGEIALQREAGVAEKMARLGPKGIRSHLPEQHREFYPQLPFVIVGSVDEQMLPTASLLAAPPGFAHSPTPTTLRIDALPQRDDPLDANLRPGAPFGLLGIQPHTRRRNRTNGAVLARDSQGLTLGVSQSFGNCQKYIHARELAYRAPRAAAPVQTSSELDVATRAWIAAADTFFIASAHPAARALRGRAFGVDVSHRGGPPGFLHFTGENTFLIPDYRGNDLYNTLGNLRLNAAAGLLFIDLERGHLLQLATVAEALAGPHPAEGDQGRGRLVRFTVQGVRFFPGAAPLAGRGLNASRAVSSPPL